MELLFSLGLNLKEVYKRNATIMLDNLKSIVLGFSDKELYEKIQSIRLATPTYVDYFTDNSEVYTNIKELKKQLLLNPDSISAEVKAVIAKIDALKDNLDRLKMGLPFFMPTGICEYGHFESTLKYNQVVQFDVDFKTKGGDLLAQSLKAKILNLYEKGDLPCLVYAFLSPSGYGVKFAILSNLIDTKHYKEVQKVLNLNFSKLFETDLKYFDNLPIAQTCYLSFDSKAFFNSFIVPADVSFIPKEEPRPQIKRDYSFDSSDIVEKAAYYLIRNKVVVASEYHEYFKCLSACVSAFGKSKGLEVAKDILSNSPNYWDSTFRRNINSHLKGIVSGKISGGTLVYWAKEHGFRA